METSLKERCKNEKEVWHSIAQKDENVKHFDSMIEEEEELLLNNFIARSC